MHTAPKSQGLAAGPLALYSLYALLCAGLFVSPRSSCQPVIKSLVA